MSRARQKKKKPDPLLMNQIRFGLIVKDMSDRKRFTGIWRPDALEKIQRTIEEWLLDLFQQAKLEAGKNNRGTVTTEDLKKIM